ncbi:VOC family protein [Kytococcus sp. HMSC28H12]|uniref:VOC family protein n=1 Tax=Kytococcus TaxID=57499 RepID=UPI00143A6190|nr:hypothetical protein [Kytococcus sp. HMSC28H12]
MHRPVQFEIHVTDVPAARAFYGAALGWTFEDWSEYAGMAWQGSFRDVDGNVFGTHQPDPEAI